MTARRMIVRNGVCTTLRARGRTALFTALILSVTPSAWDGRTVTAISLSAILAAAFLCQRIEKDA